MGVAGGLTPVVLGAGSGSLCSGRYEVGGLFFSGGKGIFGNIALRANSEGSISGGRAAIGIGGGGAGGIESCVLRLICFNDPPCGCEGKPCECPDR
jgi:hypothetical protein